MMLLVAKIWIIIDITITLIFLLLVFIAGSFFELEVDESYSSQDEYVRDTVTMFSVFLYINFLQYFLLNRARHFAKHPELYSGEATENENVVENEK
ncbi:unnamed protein product [Caenorhabditis angaria]|uniref:Uncharacterized protein n=1 Tax=Caenorhabditis angaria TaxID=860376 RepID=A0A9P1N1G1_9PELO|nr:unnamed protein product [Caenorhabditis angaria]